MILKQYEKMFKKSKSEMNGIYAIHISTDKQVLETEAKSFREVVQMYIKQSTKYTVCPF